MADRINIARNNSVIIDPPSFEYTGEVCIPKVTVIVNDIVLTESVDYTIEFGEEHINAGTVPITITGIDNYIGIIRKSYRITPISIVNAE
jgi:hypothetical protein